MRRSLAMPIPHANRLMSCRARRRRRSGQTACLRSRHRSSRRRCSAFPSSRSDRTAIPAADGSLPDRAQARHDRDRYEQPLPVSRDGRRTAKRYGVGVGKPGFEWAGTHTVTRKAEWPDWHPPKEMIAREAAKGHYLRSRWKAVRKIRGCARHVSRLHLYRIHGTNAPWTIGSAVFVRLHPHAQRRCDRPLWPRECRHEGHRDVKVAAWQGLRAGFDLIDHSAQWIFVRIKDFAEGHIWIYVEAKAEA